MLETLKKRHNKETYLFATSRMFERASYYGLRALIIMYMIGEILNMSEMDALERYGFLTASILFTQIIGALLGDLLIGNKRALIIGIIMQSIGAFTLCIPSITGLYIGAGLISLGSGFYTPNILSELGKSISSKPKLLDASITLFYMAINLGAFLGVITLGYIGEVYGWKAGFICSGIVVLVSIIPILFIRSNDFDFDVNTTIPHSTTNQRILKISFTFLIAALFWVIYELASSSFFETQYKLLELTTWSIPNYIWTSSNSILIILASLIAGIVWTFYYNSQFTKLLIGFISAVISFSILLIIPEKVTEQHFILYVVAILLLAISEVHIAPIVYSILIKYSNPKYLAIMMSLSFFAVRLFNLMFILFEQIIFTKPLTPLIIAIALALLVGVGLIIYRFTFKNKKNLDFKDVLES